MEEAASVDQSSKQLPRLYSLLLGIDRVKSRAEDVVDVSIGSGFDLADVLVAGLVKDKLVPGDSEGGSCAGRGLLGADHSLLISCEL